MRSMLPVALLGLMILTSACSLFRKVPKADPTAVLLKEIMKETTASNLEYDNVYMSGKAKLSMPEGELKNLSVNYRIYMDKGEEIMIRINKFIEVARVLITPDSIFALDKINNQVYVLPVSAAEKYIGMKADFSIIEDMLLGNFHPLSKKVEAGELTANPARLTSIVGTANVTYNIDTEIDKLLSVSVIDSVQDAQATIDYASFSELGGVQVPNAIDIDVTAPQEAGAEFTHRKIELNKANFSISFEVPSHYERVNY